MYIITPMPTCFFYLIDFNSAAQAFLWRWQWYEYSADSQFRCQRAECMLADVSPPVNQDFTLHLMDVFASTV